MFRVNIPAVHEGTDATAAHQKARLEGLESLEKIADKVEKITVVGNLNSLLDKAVRAD